MMGSKARYVWTTGLGWASYTARVSLTLIRKECSMSNATSAEIATARRNWKEEHLSMYLRSGGSEGHIVNLSDIGGHKFTTTLLLKYVGRKSGKTMITPLIYGDIGGAVGILAAKGGAPHHPAWDLHVSDRKEVRFQL